MPNNKSPLRYPGGKTRACRVLDDVLNDHFDMSSGRFRTIVSPFFGGGSFEFHLQSKYGLRIVANDKFGPLCDFWRTCKESKDELCVRLRHKLGTIDVEVFTDMRNRIVDAIQTDMMDRSVMYFVINRCSFSGATLSGGFSLEASEKRFTESSVSRIESLDLSAFDIESRDFEEFLEEQPMDESTIMFLDPPYYLEKASKLYGTNGDLHEAFDHEKLRRCLTKKKNWLMTYNDCEYIRRLYEEYMIVDVDWSYGMNKTKKSSEIVIIG